MANRNYTHMGRRLRHLRESLDLRVVDVARVVGVDPSFVSHVEAGRSGVSLRVLQQLAALFDRSVGELLDEGTLWLR
jgi:transcriptional regulator with XRE-family HTH domain